MRFRAELRNVRTFSKLVAALSSVEKITWARLDSDCARFTVIPDRGTQVWASLGKSLIFEEYHIQSAETNNTINLELPLPALQRALKSAANSHSASIRLTKKDGRPVLSLTIATTAGEGAGAITSGRRGGHAGEGLSAPEHADDFPNETTLRHGREKIITQDIPVRVLHPATVETVMQPRVAPTVVHIQLPKLLQLKSISERFVRLASASSAPARLEISANMHGSLRLSSSSDSAKLESTWSELENPQLDPAQLDRPIEEHPSTRYREEGPDKWATVRVDGKDWIKILSVGRVEGRVIAAFADGNALTLYVYVPHYDCNAPEDDSVITYYVQSYSA